MKVSLGTIEVDDDVRRAIRAQTSNDGGLATRKEVRDAFLSLADADLAVLVGEWREEGQ